MSNQKAPGKKFALFKSPFAAPKWPPPQDKDVDSDEEFFSRSSHTYALLAADEEERKKRKRDAQGAEAGASSTATPSTKKTRPSLDAGHELEKSVTKSPSGSSSSVLESKAAPSSPPLPSSGQDDLAARHQSPEAGSSANAPVIDVESDDEDDVLVTSFQTRRTNDTLSQPTPAASFSEPSTTDRQLDTGNRSRNPDALSDDEVLETTGDAFSPILDTLRSHKKPAVAPEPPEELLQSSKKPAAAPQPAVEEPKVAVLITSKIEGTSPLIVQRKLGQRLKEARLEWCHRQQFPPEQVAQIVLTWRGKRIYDSTSCRALGIGTDGHGNVVGDGEKDLFGIDDRRIHMEAMTEEMLLQAKQARTVSKVVEAAASADASAAPPPPRSPKEPRKRLILRCAGFEELKFLVKPTFFISRLVNEFRERRQVDQARQITIRFDGEELDPQRTIDDCEIDDMDTLDVYVK